MTTEHWTQEDIRDKLVGRHQDLNHGDFTFSFPVIAPSPVHDSTTIRFTQPGAAQQANIRQAMSAWNDLIPQNIVEIPQAGYVGGPSKDASVADIQFVNAQNSHFRMWNGDFYSDPGAGEIWFKAGSSQMNPTPGSAAYTDLLNETGRLLGMNVMGNYYRGSPNWGPSSQEDSTVYSVMSLYGPGALFGSHGVAGADWVGRNGTRYYPQTPMLSDVMALQFKYGVSTTTRTDDTIYGFHSNVDGADAKLYNFDLNVHPILTLFDSAGNDTLDLSGWTADSRVSLVPGTFTSGNWMGNIIAIANSCIIENAITGNGNDTITGNDAANILDAGAGNDTLFGGDGNDTLTGGRGNDTIDGGAGENTVCFSGKRADYLITLDTPGYSLHPTFVIVDHSKTDGTDIVINCQNAQFSDMTVQLTGQVAGPIG
jgi:serralysin